MRLLLLTFVLVHANLARRHHHRETSSVDPHKEKIVVDSDTGIQYNPYSKHYPGRHVCASPKNVTVKTREVVCKPIFKKYQQRCQGNQLCTGVKLVYETSYKDVSNPKNAKSVFYMCCPGWSQANNRSHGCNKAVCSTPCQNGGSCLKPNACACLKGYSGRFCEHDIDECKEQKPCDHICYNTAGSFHCQCKENFILQSDGQSCRKEDGDDIGTEVKDLEYALLDKRLLKLETMVSGMQTNEVTKGEIDIFNREMKLISNDVKTLENKIKELESSKRDIIGIKYKLNQIEKKSSKIDDLNLKYEKIKKCLFLNKICI